MTDEDLQTELQFIKLALSSTIKTIDAMHDDTDVPATVQQHMLDICAGVRQRALTAGDDASSAQATAQVDKLTATIDDYFAYAASPQFSDVELLKK